MRFVAEHASVRWAAPVAAVALIGAGSVIGSRVAEADSGLPPRSAQQLLADVQAAHVDGLSGTVVQTADLGLPNLPGMGNVSRADLTAIIAGTHTWRVWTAGPTQSRLALTGDLSESTIVRNGSDLWVWSSKDKTATHTTLPADQPHATPQGSTPGLDPSNLPKTPQEAAARALQAIEPTTEVTTSGTGKVAGRPAYDLVLKSKNRASLVAQVRIAIDAAKHVPLRVQVYSTKQANPAFEVGFTAVDFTKPDARQFTFTPPKDAKVTQLAAPAKPSTTTGKAPSATNRPSSAADKPTVVGTGWGSVVVTKATQPALAGTTGRQLQSMLGSLPRVSGAWGSGRLLSGTLFSAVLTDDGRLAVGAVSPETVYAALAVR